MNDWKEKLTVIARRCIETEKVCRAHPLAYSSCPHQGHDWAEYQVLSAEWQEAESDLWRATDVEYDDTDALRAACWQWRYCKVMARKCTYLLLKHGAKGSQLAGELMQNLHMAEMNLMGLLGLMGEYKAPTKFIEEQFPRLKKVS